MKAVCAAALSAREPHPGGQAGAHLCQATCHCHEGLSLSARLPSLFSVLLGTLSYIFLMGACSFSHKTDAM